MLILTGNTILLMLAGIFHQGYGDMAGRCSGNLFDPLHYVSALVLIEMVIISSILVSYMGKLIFLLMSESPIFGLSKFQPRLVNSII